MKVKVMVDGKVLQRTVFHKGKTPYVRANHALYEVMWEDQDAVYGTKLLLEEKSPDSDEFDYSSDRDVTMTSYQSRDLIRNIAKAYHHTGTRFEDMPGSEKYKYHEFARILNMIATTIEGSTDYREMIFDDLKQIRAAQGDYARPVCTEIGFEQEVRDPSLWGILKSMFK
jgi:hypothetical protein